MEPTKQTLTPWLSRVSSGETSSPLRRPKRRHASCSEGTATATWSRGIGR
jgi:hypothetical protein